MKPVGPGRLPYNGGVPRHWRCRSAEIPTTYTWEELGISGLGETRAVVEGGERASMFGPTTKRGFDSWLKSLTPEEQDGVLGSARLGTAFRSGQLSSVKQLVDAATGRQLLFREMEDLGLVPPRYTAWAFAQGPGGGISGPMAAGQYVPPEEIDNLRQAILDEAKDRNSDYNKLLKLQDAIENELIGIASDLENHNFGDVPLSDAKVARLKARLNELRAEQRALEKKEATYFAEKYLYGLTPGKLDVKVQRGRAAAALAKEQYRHEISVLDAERKAVQGQIAARKAAGQPVPSSLTARDKELTKEINRTRRFMARLDSTDLLPKSVEETIDEGVEVFNNLIGENSPLASKWDGEPGYWQGHQTRLGFDYPSFMRLDEAGERYFAFVPGDSTSFFGGGRHGLINLRESDAGRLDNVVHEMAHFLELGDSDTVRRTVDYMRRRCGSTWGTPSFTSVPGWKSEYAQIITGFLEPYQGSVYGTNLMTPTATEVISKMLENMAFNTVSLARQDPQTFEFAIRLLTGNWQGWDYSGLGGGA